MQLLEARAGRLLAQPYTRIQFENVVLHPQTIEDRLRAHAQPDGTLRGLSLLFEGEEVPLYDVQDIRLAATLLAIYHNSLVRSSAGDLNLEPYPMEARDLFPGDHEADVETSESDAPPELDPEFEQNAGIGNPDEGYMLGRAGMMNHLW